MTLHEFARRMPKVELHVHLEGSIRPATLLQLARRNSVSLPAQDVEGLRDFYRFRDFSHFVEVYVTITRCLHTPDDYRLIAYEFGADCARQHVRYAEVTFTIATNTKYTGLPWQAILEGLNRGRDQARAEFGVDWGWVFDICRNDPDTQDRVVEIALAARDEGVVALGLGGPEAGFPPQLFEQSFERARQAGLPSVPHAGEMAGPESVWAALRVLHADRLGHGVRSVEDPALVEYLRERQVVLEVCPTSNVCLGVYPDYGSHPLRRLWDAGLLITVNSDDPPMFGADLNQEYEVLVDHFGFSADELEQVSLNGLRASFLPPAEKARLEAEFRAEFAQLREERNV
ncbi:MAG: adenosine deaminase [Chloroflexi bacterium]|nr:adenosine deaminase [Chloroflexota bacterium]